VKALLDPVGIVEGILGKNFYTAAAGGYLGGRKKTSWEEKREGGRGQSFLDFFHLFVQREGGREMGILNGEGGKVFASTGWFVWGASGEKKNRRRPN